ncbi:hypothetical protein BDZ97DRAFT_2069346 [Flammula alnicola]|nr:hypothetical protein BDZ97DRAFT_2069346 [Flammula alnicola]
MKVLVAVAALLSAASANNVVLYHRVFHPSLPVQPYLERGSVSLSSAPTFVPSPVLAEDFNSFSEALQTLEDPTNALYQVALQHEADTSDALWDFSSVKVCYLSKVSSETILLHLDGGNDSKPYALDYFVSPTPHDGSCPLSKSKKSILPASSLKSFAKRIQTINSTVLLRGTETPPLPELKAPPPLTPEGEVVTPPLEKNFLQKYWMYIGAVLLVILVSGGQEEEPVKKS